MSHKKQGYLQLLLVIIIVVGSFSISRMLGAEQEQADSGYSSPLQIEVDAVHLSPGPHRMVFETTGNIEARSEISVTPQVSGRVVKINDRFFQGGAFQADESLFQIESVDYELEVQRLQAEVARAHTALKLERAEADSALAEWAQLHGESEAPELVSRKPQVAEALAQLEAAQAQLALAKLNVERTRFSLPFNGKVLQSNLALGQYVNAGQSYGTVFAIDTLVISATFDSRQLQWLLGAEKPRITARVDYLGETQEFEVQLVRGVAEIDTATRFANVQFEATEHGATILPGMFVDLRVEGALLENILLLPLESLQKDGRVWKVAGDGRLTSSQPEVLYTNDTEVAVTWDGGPVQIVTSRLSGVTEGTQVNVNPSRNSGTSSNLGLSQVEQADGGKS